MPAHGGINIYPIRPLPDIEKLVDGVNVELVTVRFSRRRARRKISCVTAIIDT